MPTRPTGRRARNRAARHDQLMAAATDIVTDEGLDRPDYAGGRGAGRVRGRHHLHVLQLEVRPALRAAGLGHPDAHGQLPRGGGDVEDELSESDLDDARVVAGPPRGVRSDLRGLLGPAPREFELLQMLISPART